MSTAWKKKITWEDLDPTNWIERPWPDFRNKKFNPYHDERGRFSDSPVSGLPGSHMGQFTPEEQAEIVTTLKKKGVDHNKGMAFGEQMMQHSQEQGHFEEDKIWYEKAGEMSRALAKRYGVTESQAAGAIAALSPQVKWDLLTAEGKFKMPNVKNALTIAKMVKQNPDITIDRQFLTDYGKYEDKAHFKELEGKTVKLADLNPVQQGYFLSKYIIAYPANATKAVRILSGEDPEKVLGGLKVRSFYNNIMEPLSPKFTTIDTWMVKILSGLPIRGNDDAGPILSSPKKGRIPGSYPFWEDMISEIASKWKVTPAQAQAIMWVQARRETGEGAILKGVVTPIYRG